MSVSKELVRGSLGPIILRLLSERPMYGYEIVKLVDARTNGLLQWKEGTLYPALHRLEADGLIRGEWRTVATAAGNESDRQRKYYAITRSGKAALKEKTAEWSSFSAAVAMLLSQA
jgi:DNA-binding PadR family transcriptional regulator